jgi:hypothetical protein
MDVASLENVLKKWIRNAELGKLNTSMAVMVMKM